jgi:hypothetical protein
MSEQRKLKLSINIELINKIEPSNTRSYAEGFEPCEVTLEELEETVRLGVAFSYQFEHDYRRSENFLASDVLVVEIDGGLKLNECLQIPLIENHCSFFYTTPSHTINHHRYRLVFATPRTITDPNELRYASRALAQRLGGDQRCTSPAGLFLGSSDCISERFDAAISDELLEELIGDGRNNVANDSIANNRPTANRSGRKIPQTQSITLADGTSQTLREIIDNRPVFCPFHHDARPGAFVAQSRKGRFLHCSNCQKTWWMAGLGEPGGSFFAFDDMVTAMKDSVQAANPDDLTVLEKGMGIDRIKPKNILIADERYLNPTNLNRWDLSKGVTFVKSPKGTGKTTFLAGLVKRATTRFSSLEQYEVEDDPESPTRWYSDENVLLIGHRQALIGELCQ